MDVKTIQIHQKIDKQIQNFINDNKDDISSKTIDEIKLITFKNKIFIPRALRKEILEWYHQYLCHPGMTRMTKTIGRQMYWPTLRKDVENFVKSCSTCQTMKRPQKKYGKLGPKQVESEAWSTVCLDSIGKWTITTQKGEISLRALTMIDPVTGWIEIGVQRDCTPEEVANIFTDEWLSRYPKPRKVIFDNGSEFKKEFQQLCAEYGIKAKPTSVKNPQANGICERVHQVIANMIRTFNVPELDINLQDPWSEIINAVAWAIRSSYNTGIDATPGELVFGRDMI